MSRRVSLVALLVDDYDAAIRHFVDDLGFVLLEDSDRGGGKRWVRVAPAADSTTALLLARAVGDRQQAAIGDQHGGRVGWFLETDDFWRDYRRMQSRGVRFCEAPREEDYATVVVFEDRYGNRWDLLQPRGETPG
jgi:catechol 2,3-dioxygenase-like lactoylglutathione lyase family enzyme